MPEAVAAKLQELCQIDYIEGYGMSETMAATHINPPDRPRKQCLGIPIFDVDARVVDPATFTEPPGEVGEIIVHGPQLMQGYWGQAEATAQAFVTLEGKRFLRTGDLAHRRGWLLLHGGQAQAHDQCLGLQGLAGRGRGPDGRPPGDPGGLRDRRGDERRGETVKAVVVLRDAFRGAR